MAATLDELVEKVQIRRALPPPEEARAVRLSLGLTLEDVAGPCGVTARALSAWELGDRRPSAANAARYLAVLRALEEAEAA